MGISDIARTIHRTLGEEGSISEGAAATVTMVDRAFHVKLHGIELGVRELNDPEAGQPNPIEIRYSQEFEIVVQKTVGQKPLTQCTIPDGLWNIVVKYNSLKGTDGDISEKLKSIRDLKAGPKKFFSALFPGEGNSGGICTYITKKEIVQSKGADDWYHSVEITLMQANGGDI
jgi:hypothetical protein